MQAGVYEDLEALAGTYVLTLYDADGRRIGRWEAIAGVTDENLCVAFEEFIERRSPARTLRLVADTSGYTRARWSWNFSGNRSRILIRTACSSAARRSNAAAELGIFFEGYTLSDDSFVTREEARERFAGADIGPARVARSKKCGLTDPEGPQCA